jgi:hypothetical protein
MTDFSWHTLIDVATQKAGGTRKALAERLGHTDPSMLSKKLSGECGWQEREINIVLELANPMESIRETITTYKNALLHSLLESTGPSRGHF